VLGPGRDQTVTLQLQRSVRLADYVLAHELAHLIEPHHGREFWATLDRALPDRQVRQQELRKKAGDLYWCNAEMARGAAPVSGG
jgi:hypothetical protein